MPACGATYVIAFWHRPCGDGLGSRCWSSIPGRATCTGFGRPIRDEQGKGLGTLVSLRVLHQFKRDGVCATPCSRRRRSALRRVRDLFTAWGFVPEYRYGDPDEQLRWARLLSRLVA